MRHKDLIPAFLTTLRREIESCAFLRHGKAFLPPYLKGWKLSKGFRRVMRPVANRLRLEFHEQGVNRFPSVYQCGAHQIVDYVLGPRERPLIYCELETLARPSAALPVLGSTKCAHTRKHE
jgi:hypothetical protein